VLAVLAGGARAQQFVVLELRLPRVAVGALVGAALGVAGALTQAVARNPLASPDVLGVTAGAGVAAVAVIALGGTSGVVGPLLAGVGLPVAAVVGGLGAAALAYALAWRHGLDGYRLVLVGIGIDAAATALIDWLLVITKVQDAARATVWLTGSLNGRGWEQVVPVAVALVVLVPAALLLSARVGVLQLGDDSARGLGLRVDRTRAALVVLAVALAAVATSAAGPIAFVAFLSGPIAARLVGADGSLLVPAGLVGALLVLVADFAGQFAFDLRYPVGVVTGVLGAPYLVYLIVRTHRAGGSL
jgi:iron complex transport system permease protein